jgi:hypothetical protein
MSEAQGQQAGREDNGRFAKGNPGGVGNPFARKMAEMRQAARDAVSEEDIKEIMAKMAEKAKQGDTAAARLVLAYAVGTPRPAEEPDRMDEQEWKGWVEETVRHGEMDGITGGMNAKLACTIARTVVPGMQEEAARSLHAGIEEMNERDREQGQEAEDISPRRPQRAAEEGARQEAGEKETPEAPSAAVDPLARLRGLLRTSGANVELTRLAANPEQT